MTAAVTGAGGFIGRRLVAQLLRRGWEVRVLSRNPGARFPSGVAAFRGDLGQAGPIPSGFVEGAGVLFHCAAETRQEAAMEAVNTGGTARLIRAARGRIGHWVQLSSVGAYGQREAGDVRETDALRPAGAYETTKAESDRLVWDAALEGSFPATILRPSIVYGPEMSNRSLYSMIGMIDRGLFFYVGPRGASANYVHVDNVVQALLLCAGRAGDGASVYNLSDHAPLEQVVEVIAGVLGKPAPRLRLPAAPVGLAATLLTSVWRGCPLTPSRLRALSNRSRYPIDKIRAELGYQHRVTMEEGFRELAKAWKSRQA